MALFGRKRFGECARDFLFRKWDNGGGELTGSMLEQRLDTPFVQSQYKYAKDIKAAKKSRNAKRDDCATPLEIHNHLSANSQRNWLAGQTVPDLNCQISLAQQCMPMPTVGQIRQANQWVRCSRQFADLHLKFLSIPLRDLRFVEHTDYSSK